MSAEQSTKRTVNLSIDGELLDSELLDEARRLNIDISETLEQRLRRLVMRCAGVALEGRESRSNRIHQCLY